MLIRFPYIGGSCLNHGWGSERFIRHGNMPDPVTGECPDLMVHVTKAGHVEGVVDKPAFTITLYPFVCTIASGTINLHEHAAVTWLPKEDLAALDWAEADLPVLASYCRFSGQGQVTS
jgi:hypothetical protein